MRVNWISVVYRMAVRASRVALMGLLGTGKARMGQGVRGGEALLIRPELGSVSVGEPGHLQRDLPPLTEL